MKHSYKRAGALLLALAMVLALAACGGGGGGVSAFDSTKYIQGLLDKTYIGKYDDYMDVVDITENECEEDYIAGMETEAEYFAKVFDIENLTDDLKAEIVDLYKQIYAKSKYTVDPATKVDDKTFSIKVTVEPIDIFHQVSDALDNGVLDEFYAEYDEVDVNAMTEAEYEEFYAEFDAAWARMIIDQVKEALPNLGYLEAESILVQVAEDEGGTWGIPQKDFDNLDWIIIDYNF